MAPSTDPIPPQVPAKPEWKNFRAIIDDNVGVMNKPRRTATGTDDSFYFTNNFYAGISFLPKALAGRYIGMATNLMTWIKTVDSDPEKSRSTFRLFLGPQVYVRPLDTSSWRMQFSDGAYVFWGHDLNEPEAKTWKSWEFGNKAELQLTYKPWGLSANGYLWWVRGLHVNGPADVHLEEDCLVPGAVLSYKLPFETGISIVDNIGVYGKYEKWGVEVAPEKQSGKREWWDQISFGITMTPPF